MCLEQSNLNVTVSVWIQKIIISFSLVIVTNDLIIYLMEYKQEYITLLNNCTTNTNNFED